MGTLKLRTILSQKMTAVSNRFLDHYMPRANGEFVKIYLLLLKSCQNGEDSFSLPEMADTLNCTEGDVLRAIHYWEKEGLLMLEMAANGEIAGIMLSEPADKESLVLSPVSSTTASEDVTTSPSSILAAEDKANLPEKKTAAPRKKVSPERQEELVADSDISEMTFIISQYLGHPMSKTELEKVLYFYDELHFSTELIEYLFEYCVENNHKSFRYIETVAINWHSQGISTVDEAKETLGQYNKDYFEILRAFGISGRSPIKTETRYMDTWLNSYGFSMEIIGEACSRTVLKTGNPNFKYADSILNKWHKSGASTLEDISRLDADHDKKAQEKAETVSLRRPARVSEYNRFDQRTYDYDDLKNKLLKGRA